MCNTQKSFKIMLAVCSIGIALNLVSFILTIVNYRISTNSLYYFEKNFPDYNFTGLRDFEFIRKSNNGGKQEYSLYSPNLGNTGKLIFDCYNGLCKYYNQYKCGDSKQLTCYERKDYSTLSCSRECRISNASNCGLSNCKSGYASYTTMCSHEKETEEYFDQQSCYADNIIYSWENHYYSSTNATKYGRYSYLNGVVPSSESCPSGTKMCGILDNLGNKLCISNSEDCPINYITLDKSNLPYTFKSTTIDNLTIYYTNEATEKGKIVGGLFVDSDLLIKYNKEDCEILATSTISSLLNSQNNKLYRNSLNFDPYKEDIDQKGKSYLKWCVPGYGKEKSIAKIKKLHDEYLYNISMNENVIPYLDNLQFSTLGNIPGNIDGIFAICIFCFLFYRQNNLNNKYKKDYLDRMAATIFLCIMCFATFVLIIGIFLFRSSRSQLTKAIQQEQKNSFTTIYTNNTICIWINVIIIVFNLGLLFYRSRYLVNKTNNQNIYGNINMNNANYNNQNYNGNNAVTNNIGANAQLLEGTNTQK